MDKDILHQLLFLLEKDEKTFNYMHVTLLR
jgi:hypothetical protein